ncbi:MAG TPA: hypothetical protein PK916_14380 [Bacteroidota bacterium]|nr:hypothetical protein [Bacteroidota bacterium]
MKRIILIFALLLPSTLSAQPVTLRYNLPAARTLNFKHIESMSALAQTNDGRSTQFEKSVTRYVRLDFAASTPSGVEYVFVQDTAVVVDKNPPLVPPKVDIDNLITKKPIRVKLSPRGTVEGATPLEPLRAEALLGVQGADAMFARNAAILPPVPDRELSPGATWTESSRDTLYPSKELPQLGRGSGLRIVENVTTWTVESRETRHGIACLKLRWEGRVLFEEKILFAKLEEFTEERSSIEGSMYVDIATGIPVSLDVKTDKESTRALFGDQNNVLPSSVSTIVTLELIP